METELFPVKKHIPQWLADYFHACNAVNFTYKQSFYRIIKPVVLEQYGEFAGYDLQVINKPCHSCGGTGVYKHYWHEYGERFTIKKEKCWNCTDGIYMTKRISLKRYVLNGVVYHIPCDNIVAEPVKNKIEGYITHEPVTATDINHAYIVLLWKFNKPFFYQHIKWMIGQWSGKQKRAMQDLIQLCIRKENLSDELPF